MSHKTVDISSLLIAARGRDRQHWFGGQKHGHLAPVPVIGGIARPTDSSIRSFFLHHTLRKKWQIYFMFVFNFRPTLKSKSKFN